MGVWGYQVGERVYGVTDRVGERPTDRLTDRGDHGPWVSEQVNG
jgi:hypothetical protein